MFVHARAALETICDYSLNDGVSAGSCGVAVARDRAQRPIFLVVEADGDRVLAMGYRRFAQRKLEATCRSLSLARGLLATHRAFVAFFTGREACHESSAPCAFIGRLCGNRLEYAGAANDRAILVRGDGRHEHLDATGPPIGTAGERAFLTGSAQVRAGDALVVASKAVLDASGSGTNARFGTRGLIRACAEQCERGSILSSSAILSAAFAYAGERSRCDAAVLVVRFVAAMAAASA